MTSQQPTSGTLLSKYVNRLLDDGGNVTAAKSFAYRGQLAAEWELHSSAYRRLSRSAAASGSAGVPNDQQITYNKNLISDFRNRRFDTVDGVTFTDLEVLCQLQHLGSATSLIDFSRNPLALIVHGCVVLGGARPRKSPFGVGRCVLVSTFRFHRKGHLRDAG